MSQKNFGMSGEISLRWEIQGWHHDMKQELWHYALNSEDDNFGTNQWVLIVFFTDINVLFNFTSMFATNVCMFVISIACEKSEYFIVVSRAMYELWTDAMKTKGCSKVTYHNSIIHNFKYVNAEKDGFWGLDMPTCKTGFLSATVINSSCIF